MRARSALPVLALAALAAALPGVASAHLNASGMGPIYDGVVHFGLSPEDSLPVAALGLYAGLRGPAASRLLLAVAPLAWIAGGALAMAGVSVPAVVLSCATAALFLGVGGLLAANVALAPRWIAAAAAALGLVRGLADLAGVEMSLPHTGALLGMAACVFALFALAASLTLPLKQLWMIVAVRVGGSWLAATGLLLVGWIWRYGAKAL
ncbi:MAG: HupE/UreJ family protein [Proteobacteria bacterium]|nr:HupE/UreJ family protein [Pseudomonadota bacterium]